MTRETKSTHTENSPSAQLREYLADYFEAGDLESLCFDLGLDYDGLPGDGRGAKVVNLIEYFSKSGRIIDLINRSALLRPNLDWAAIKAAAASDPAAFVTKSPLPDAVYTLPAVQVNLPPDRALKIGLILGALAMLVVVCSFTGGLVAARFINVTQSPVPSNPVVGANAALELQSLQAFHPGTALRLSYDNVKATSLATQLIAGADSPISEIHIQFLDQGDIALNTRLKSLGNRRVVTGYRVTTTPGGQLIATPEVVALDLLEIPGTTFGWIALPASIVSPLTSWIQARFNDASQHFRFDNIAIQQDRMQLIVRVR